MSDMTQTGGCVDLCPPVRNRYFYGKMLDVFHFDLEQFYFNNKRWMLNRLVTGYGVVCGLNVLLGHDKQSIIVAPGVAIDRCGREIVVAQSSPPQSLPAPSAAGTTAAPQQQQAMAPGEFCDNGSYVHVNLCYHECNSDPVPALGGDCDTQSVCSPGSIRERYEIEIVPGKLPPASTASRLQDIVSNGQINYPALANFISNPCPCPPDDCCIPLANVRIPDPGQPYAYDPSSIDITIRPIVYSNDLLYDLILAITNQTQTQSRGGKP
ncbi:MAG TPA: hypothetical protein VMI93_12210 [Candidatus Solibacter sp.]|nr:hypothetical protein [Candidatus Solibacter sp.]